MEKFRFQDSVSLYYVTFSVQHWLPIFITEQTCRIITDSLNYCHDNKGLRTTAYVIMPTHFHGIFYHESFCGLMLERTLTAFRKFTGNRLSSVVDQKFPDCFSLALRTNGKEDRERQFWQDTRHPVAIESEDFFAVKRQYIHLNPCRKGFVIRAEDWRYSSASAWLEWGPKRANDVKLSSIG
jgi:REP element-mobilizing transposase RayT